MPLIQPGQGSIPSKGELGLEGMGDALQSFVESYQKEKKDQEAKKQGNDDIIKAGLSSKTMRPAKDGEKSDFSDSSGRGWVYDDSNLKEERSQLDNQRKDAHWITINSNVEKELQQAINSGQVDGTNQNAVNMFRNQRISQYLGIGPDGKMSSELKDDLSPEGQSWVDSLTKSATTAATAKANSRTPADANLPKAGIMSALDMFPHFGGPQQKATPMGLPMNPAGMPQMPSSMGFQGTGNPGFNAGPSMPGQQGGIAIGNPNPGYDPMAVLQHVLAQTQVPNQTPNWANQQTNSQGQ